MTDLSCKERAVCTYAASVHTARLRERKGNKTAPTNGTYDPGVANGVCRCKYIQLAQHFEVRVRQLRVDDRSDDAIWIYDGEVFRVESASLVVRANTEEVQIDDGLWSVRIARFVAFLHLHDRRLSGHGCDYHVT